MHRVLIVVVATLGCGQSGGAEVDTLAGSAEEGDADGLGSAASFKNPMGIALDDAGNLYVADTINHRIRAVSPTGEVSTLAGGERGYADGAGIEARFYMPTFATYDGRGGLYVADSENHVIRRIEIATATVTTVAGVPSRAGFVDGSPSAALFDAPTGIDMERDTHRLWVADKGNNAIRIVDLTAARVDTIAGSGAGGADDGVGSAARFLRPTGVAVGGGGAWVTDTGNHTIRSVDAVGRVTTVAGAALRGGFFDGPSVEARLNWPWGIARADGGALVFADSDNGIVRVLLGGTVRRIAGRVQAGPPPRDGSAMSAVLLSPSGVAVDRAGDVFVTDRHSVRIIRGLDL